MINYKQRLIKRLLACICLAVLCTGYIVGVFFFDQQFQRKKQMECDKKAQSEFTQLVSQIRGELNQCKMPAVKMLIDLEYDPTFDYSNEESVYKALEELLGDNEILSGAIMGFEDWVYPQYAGHNGFGPLVRRSDSTLVRIQIGEHRDFRVQNEWYQKQLADPKPEWSKPFLSDDSVMIATYTIPLFDKGKYMGGFGIDIDLSRLASDIEHFSPYPSSLVVVVDEELNILIHPNRSYIGTTKLSDAMLRVGIEPNNHPLYHSKDRQGGVDYDYMGSRQMAFYYAPLADTNWMVLLYVPTDEIYEPILSSHMLFVALAIAGLLLFGTAFGISIYRYMREYKMYHTMGSGGYSD